MKKMLFVLNPRSGTRKAAKHLTDILSVFSHAGYAVTVYITEGPGDGRRMTEKTAPENDIVVCCGGDGTFHETVNGLLRSGADIPIGYIPAGSTNDFALSINLSLDPLQAARDIVEGTAVPYDIGCIHPHYFAYVASFGAFTKASYATSQTMKNAIGHAAYLLSGIQELSQLHPIPLRVEINGETLEDAYLFGAVSNATSVGRILTLDPSQVDMADGKLELMLIRAPKDLAELSGCIRALQTHRYDCGMITFRSAGSLKITAPPGLIWTLDGERFDAPEALEITNIHHGIRLLQKG